MSKADIVYICKGNGAECYLAPYCIYRHDPVANGDPVCSHTIDPELAKNGPCEDPSAHTDRFIFQQTTVVRDGQTYSGYYWEEG